MKSKRYTEEQIIGVLKEAEAGAKTKEPSPRLPVDRGTLSLQVAQKRRLEPATVRP
jgi:hypothetical protein